MIKVDSDSNIADVMTKRGFVASFLFHRQGKVYLMVLSLLRTLCNVSIYYERSILFPTGFCSIRPSLVRWALSLGCELFSGELLSCMNYKGVL